MKCTRVIENLYNLDINSLENEIYNIKNNIFFIDDSNIIYLKLNLLNNYQSLYGLSKHIIDNIDNNFNIEDIKYITEWE